MRLARLVASGFGIGYAPFAPGTVASVAALVVGAAMLLISPILLGVAALVASVGGVWVVRRARVDGDPGWVVIDEFAGQWIALLGIGRVAPAELLAAFLLFRALDIWKPGPVGWADRQHGAIGLMADDIIAGLIAVVVLFFLQPVWSAVPW
jgi:phosphatidylglycerophosphatase A